MAQRRRTRRRRPRRRRRSRRNTRSMMKSVTTGFADTAFIKMKYHDHLSMASGSFPTHTFRLNSIFDPDVTITGHQPATHDQWALFYDRYRVMGCKVTVTANTDTSATTGQVRMFMNTSRESTAPGTPIIAAESPYVTMWNVANLTAGRNISVSKYFSIKKLVGQRFINQRELSAQFGANPIQGMFLHISATTATLAIGTISPDFFVDIVYYVKLFDRLPVLTS